MKKPVDVDDLFPGRFLKAGQLRDAKPVVTISAVDLAELPDEKTGGTIIRGALSFQEMKYQMVINKTNMLCLRAMFGRDLTKWVGRKVALFAGKHRGEPAIRIWGSPELREPIEVAIKLPKQSAYKHTLHPVAPRDAGREPEVDRHPTEGQPPPSTP